MNNSQKMWWDSVFKIDCSKPQDPHWHIDLSIAHKILLPVIQRHESNIEFWRFHRQVDSDQGPLFTFYFRSEFSVAKQIYTEIDQDKFLINLREDKHIERVVHQENEEEGKPNIEDNLPLEDPKNTDNPPIELRKSWPFYMMGVSGMWVNLIERIYTSDKFKDRELNSTQDILNVYREIDDIISDMWKKNGRHKLLHFLSAIFGYKEIDVTFPILYPDSHRIVCDDEEKPVQFFANF